MATPLSTDAEAYLSRVDPLLGEVITRYSPLEPRTRSEDYFTALSRSITGQQISVKAAAAIFGRFIDKTNGDPLTVTRLTDEEVAAIGFSGQKWRYISDLAEHFVQDSAVYDHLESLSDDEIIIELTKVKGIGVWTAQMFLIFTLHRPDIFAPDDRGLQIAIERLYELSATPSRSELMALAEKWSPYRSTASFYLWKSLDNEPA